MSLSQKEIRIKYKCAAITGLVLDQKLASWSTKMIAELAGKIADAAIEDDKAHQLKFSQQKAATIHSANKAKKAASKSKPLTLFDSLKGIIKHGPMSNADYAITIRAIQAFCVNRKLKSTAFIRTYEQPNFDQLFLQTKGCSKNGLKRIHALMEINGISRKQA